MDGGVVNSVSAGGFSHHHQQVSGGSTGQLSSSGGSTGAGSGTLRMHHSHSTPAGVDGGARTPPATPKKGGKMLAVRVQMLDDTVTLFQVQAKALGRVLFEQVCKQLHLLEADYFGLEYQDIAGTRYWLDLQKPVSRQLGLSLVDPLLHFCVKFYTPDPAQLEEEFTRYLFCLQVKRDLSQGFLQCNDNTAALMASYIVQAECGDYVVEDYPDHTYLSSYKFVPHQDQELERRIMENHKKHAGQSPAEADLNLLETARRCELYGMKMHPAKDHEGVLLNLAVAHMGIVVFQNYTKINTFSWAKIRKISFKRKRFLVKLHPEGYGYYKDTVEFFFEGRNECKNFWKKCVENHGFFRCSSVKNIPRQKTRVLSRGSSFRYSGRTQKQIVEFVRDNYVKRQTFQRSASFRHSSAHSSAANVHSSLVGNSISAHPLLPLADNSLVNAGPVGSSLSTSLGSMGPGRVPAPVSPTTRGAYRPHDTATSWNTGAPAVTSTITQDCRTTSSPSPPLTTLSASPVTSAATSPQRTLPGSRVPGAAASAGRITSTTAAEAASTTSIITTTITNSSSNNNNSGSSSSPACTRRGRPASPVAVRAAVHRADTGQTTCTSCSNTRSTQPPPAPPRHTPHLTHTATHTHNTTHSQVSAVVAPTPVPAPIHCHTHTTHIPCSHNHSSSANITTRTLCNGTALGAVSVVSASADLRQKSEGALDRAGRGVERPLLPRGPPTQTQSHIELATTRRDAPITDVNGGSEDSAGSSGGSSSPEYQAPQYRSETALPKRQLWQRSASCRDLYDFSFEDSGQAKRLAAAAATAAAAKSVAMAAAAATAAAAASAASSTAATRRPAVEKSYIAMEERRLESPVTRYDDAHRALYSSSCGGSRGAGLDLRAADLEDVAPSHKVYSSSYPGTTSLSQESVEDSTNYELVESQDDLSHDSYELLERSDDEDEAEDYGAVSLASSEGAKRGGRGGGRVGAGPRSCSLDSGNYLPTDTESEDSGAGRRSHHTHNGHLQQPSKCRSSSDVHQDIFSMEEDPRDLPREKVPRNSDGAFYRHLRLGAGSRTSSLESRTTGDQRGHGLGSRTSSQESRSDYDSDRNRTGGRMRRSFESSVSTDYTDEPRLSYRHEYDRKIQFERNYGTQPPRASSRVTAPPPAPYDSFPTFKETSHVHSISLQNVETEQNLRTNRQIAEQNTVPRTHKATVQAAAAGHTTTVGIRSQGSVDKAEPREPRRATATMTNSSTTTHIWPESIAGVPTELQDWTSRPPRNQRSIDSADNNIFSFDEDKIQSLQESDLEIGMCSQHSAYSIVAAADKDRERECEAQEATVPPPVHYSREALFPEIEPKRLEMGRTDGQLPLHQPIERTKSDPNSIANRQRLGSGSRRHTLMHQKSIDLTPAESSDEDYIFRQIPSAPPLTKHRGPHFEMPSVMAAEFGHFDILKRDGGEGQRTRFEVPKSQFEVLGAKTQSDLTNLPPKEDLDIPYVLHKRHMMNGTAPRTDTTTTEDERVEEEEVEIVEPEVTVQQPPCVTSPRWRPEPDSSDEAVPPLVGGTPSEPVEPVGPGCCFLFTQNIDLSKIDPVTLEVDKNAAPVQHTASPKRDITRIDPAMLEALSSKLSQIESDSPTSSKTESLRPDKVIVPPLLSQPIITPPVVVKPPPVPQVRPVVPARDRPKGVTVSTLTPTNNTSEMNTKPKRAIKPRMQPNKKGGKNKTKVRITSFSSDDESLDSDDVFGSAEATPTRLEFSPPQSRKEMEPILRYESERQTHLQYTMSSTEVEGSPPQARKSTDHSLYERNLEPCQSEQLRRISERSISIPSSEEDAGAAAAAIAEAITPEELNRPVFLEPELEAPSLATETLTEKTLDEPTIIEQIKHADLPKDEAPPPQRLSPVLPPKEIPSPSARRKGQTPLLFAHARLNLSEGSAFAVMQRQAATTSPTAGRRAKSLDAPVISVSKLPPLNSYSSKDDTVEELCPPQEDEEDTIASEPQETPQPEANSVKEPIKETPKEPEPIKMVEEPPEIKIEQPTTPLDKELPPRPQKKEPVRKKSEEKDQIVPDVSVRTRRLNKAGQRLPSQKSAPELGSGREKIRSQRSLPLKDRGCPPKPSPRTTSLGKSRERLPAQRSLPTDPAAAETAESKQAKARSLERLELKRAGSKERARSQEDSDSDVAKRIEKQQMLYETAIKQTKTLKSPVKDVLPVFPAVEETVRVNDGKLEISIDTIENTNIPLEEAIIITKSPKRLDKKFTKSLELNLTGENGDGIDGDRGVQRLGTSLDLEKYGGDRSAIDFDSKASEPEVKPEVKLTPVALRPTDLAIGTPTSPESEGVVRQVIEAQVHTEPSEQVVLEGTSLDVWLSVDGEKPLADVAVIRRGTDGFFEEGQKEKPPDETPSVGNALDIKYIDDSGSDKSAHPQKTLTPATFAPAPKITSEDESLTEVSDLRFEAADAHLLTVTGEMSARGTLLKLSVERSRSENTDSWVTVECDEYLGEDSFEVEDAPLESPEKVTSGDTSSDPPVNLSSTVTVPVTTTTVTAPAIKSTLLSADIRPRSAALLKHSSDQSRSSDTTGSWTSGEKDLSPGNNVKAETGDESSASCSIAKTIGISQVELFESREQLVASGTKPHILERRSPVDEESSSGSNGFGRPPAPLPQEARPKPRYPFEQKWGSDSELSQRIHQKISKKLSSTSGEKSSLDEPAPPPPERKWSNGSTGSRPALSSLDRVSLESRNSLDTESSSGSLGVQARMQRSGETPPREASSTWRPFLIESSGSSSLEEGFLPTDLEQAAERRAAAGDYYCCDDGLLEGSQRDDSPYSLQDELADLSSGASGGYPCVSAAAAMGISPPDVLGGYGTGFLARTLSRISERSTNSENTSLEEDSTKASSHSDSVNDESLMSSDRQASLSSDPPSHERRAAAAAAAVVPSGAPPTIPVAPNLLLLQRQISDDRRTSAEMADLSIDDIEIITSERGLQLRRQGSDDTVIDEEQLAGEEEERNRGVFPGCSQESDDWPLPEIPTTGTIRRPRLDSLPDVASVDRAEQDARLRQITPGDIPKMFGHRASLRSQDSEQWPSPPSSLLETPVVASVEALFFVRAEEACKVVVEGAQDNEDSSEETRTDSARQHRQFWQPQLREEVEEIEDEQEEEEEESVEEEELREEEEEQGEGIVRIVLDETHSNPSRSSDSEDEDLNVTLYDDVFTDTALESVPRHELRPPTVLRRSTTSDDSSHSGARTELRPPRGSRGSHSSYSEEEGTTTSSAGTRPGEGTVRLAPRTRCTHSSHSEDTSMALSLSEWSSSTATVKFQNISGSNNSATTNTSNTTNTNNTSGTLKSDDNSLTDIAHSISDWTTSSSNSNTLVPHAFQKLSTNSSTGGDSTLTELAPSVSEWSSSDTTQIMIGQTGVNTIDIEGCLLDQLLEGDDTPPEEEEEVEVEEVVVAPPIREPPRTFTKSTERPVTIPQQQVPPLPPHQHQLISSRSTERPVKVPLKLSKCSPYYSSSLSSESTSAGMSRPAVVSKTGTVPLSRAHRKSLTKSLFMSKSPPSENDSTSSMESPVGTPEGRARAHRRRRQVPTKRHRLDRERSIAAPDYYDDVATAEPDEDAIPEVPPERFMCGKDFSDLPSDYEYKSDIIRRIYSENVEEGYFPDGDSQSGSDIFRIENEPEFEECTGAFDVSSIPPPLLEDELDGGQSE